MKSHEWKYQQAINGSDSDGNDIPYFDWYCARCDTIALTSGQYDENGDATPKDPPQPDALNCNGLREDCDEQVVINIMES
jgi:hypothetical protein